MTEAAIRRILVGYDESAPSERAFDHALELAKRFGAELLVVSVVRIPESGLLADVEGVSDIAGERFAEAFSTMQRRARELGVTLVTEVVAGHPAEQIVHLAELRRVDLIVVGSRGRSKVSRWMLGSVSERVLRYAHCPVTIIR
jgi:nucleotide-binding universal stress UspA family protein